MSDMMKSSNESPEHSEEVDNIENIQDASAFICRQIDSLLELHEHETPLSDEKLLLENIRLLRIIGKISIKLIELTDRLTEVRGRITIDQLTGCRNRVFFENFLENYDTNSRHEKVGIIFTDLNNLKQTNDTYGHAVGDELIIDAANFLNTHFRRYEDSIVRLGGDEFVVICHDYENSSDFSTNLMNKVQTIKKLEDAPKAAWGVAVYDETIDESIKSTLKRADIMMYADKMLSKGDTATVEDYRAGHIVTKIDRNT